MLYMEIIAVFSQIHTKHINTVCVGRTYNCWMLNWRYIQWPLPFAVPVSSLFQQFTKNNSCSRGRVNVKSSRESATTQGQSLRHSAALYCGHGTIRTWRSWVKKGKVSGPMQMEGKQWMCKLLTVEKHARMEWGAHSAVAEESNEFWMWRRFDW